MKKIFSSRARWFALSLLAAALVFGGCNLNSDDDDDDTSSSSSTSTSTSSSTSTASAQTVATGAKYSDTVTLDLSDSKLNSSGQSTFAVGEDVSSYFALSEVSTSRAAMGSSSIEDFKAVVTAVSESSITVEMTATVPSSSCKVVVAISIPSDYTQSGKTIVKNVAVVNVGSTASATVSSASESLSDYTKVESFSAQTLLYYSEQVGEHDTGKYSACATKDYYYVFGADGSLVRYEYYLDSAGSLLGSSMTEYKFENSKVYKHTDESDGGTYVGTLYKKDGTYYLIDDENALPRTSGSSLFATFGANEESEEEDSDGTYKAVVECSFTFCSDGTLYGYSNEERYVNGVFDRSLSTGVSGTYVNNSGILTVNMNYIDTTTYNGSIITVADSGSCYLLYDGSGLLDYTKLSTASALPQ